MTEFDPDKVEWPQEGFAYPAYEHKMSPGTDHPANVAMYYGDPPPRGVAPSKSTSKGETV